ncbi:MAG: hypothetical protein MUE68_04810 [Bacteroidetes bacterium]|jgi:hypothetical protein|nr:hypothetical protein [Bacteroidota bacterium]
MEQLWHEMQRQVCTTCIDGDPHGRCHLPVDESCALRDHLAVAHHAVVAFDGLPDQREHVREEVCRVCGTRDADGTCWRANRLECAFDRVLPAIVEHLKDLQARPA